MMPNIKSEEYVGLFKGKLLWAEADDLGRWRRIVGEGNQAKGDDRMIINVICQGQQVALIIVKKR